MKIARFYAGDLINDFFNTSTCDCTFGSWYDPNKYDLVIKDSHLEQEIRRAEEAIEANEREHDASNKYYENRRKMLVEQKEKLIMQKIKKK